MEDTYITGLTRYALWDNDAELSDRREAEPRAAMLYGPAFE